MRGEAAIVGVGIAGLGEAPGQSAMEILADAALAALDDAGLRPSDVDGLFVSTTAHFMPTASAAEYLGIRPYFSDTNMTGGSSFVAHLMTAAMALSSGVCNVALIAYGSNQRTALGRLQMNNEPLPFETAYGPRYPISGYAMMAARHMHDYGTTREQLAEVAVAARGWAALNPEAFCREPLSIDEVLDSRMISDPLTLLDCCLVTDGGGALVLVRRECAADSKRSPIHLLGVGLAHEHRQMSQMPDLTSTLARESGARAFAMARMGQTEIDLLQLYDGFTINTIMFLEDLGFCPKGEGGGYVSDGRIAPGGEVALNTNGGGLSCTHPGMYGIFLIVEAVRQLRAEAGERQVNDLETALVHGVGGMMSTHVTSVLGTDATI